LPSAPASVQHPDVLVSHPAQHPPGACGRLTRHIVVDDDGSPCGDAPRAHGLLELLDRGQGVASAGRIRVRVIGELRIEGDVAGTGDVACGEVLPAVGGGERPPDVQEHRCWRPRLHLLQLVDRDEDARARVAHSCTLVHPGLCVRVLLRHDCSPVSGCTSSTTWPSPRRVKTRVADSPAGSFSCRRTWSGTMSAPRFLMTTRPIPRATSAFRSGLMPAGRTSTMRYDDTAAAAAPSGSRSPVRYAMGPLTRRMASGPHSAVTSPARTIAPSGSNRNSPSSPIPSSSSEGTSDSCTCSVPRGPVTRAFRPGRSRTSPW